MKSSCTHTLFLFAFVLQTVLQSCRGAEGHCRFDPERCSCIWATRPAEAVCWDRIGEGVGECKRRPCSDGWECACDERTHLCSRGLHTSMHVRVADMGNDVADCSPSIATGIMKAAIKLGQVVLSLSKKGTASGSCNALAFWVDGELLSLEYATDALSSAETDAAQERRSTHTKLELFPGSTIAWRFQNASYYCFNSLAHVLVNGSSLETNLPGLELSYSTTYTPDWFEPSFEPDYAPSEMESPHSGWYSPRSRTMESDEAILPGQDFWQPPDSSSKDHKLSNFYWRLKISNPIPL